MKAKRAPKGLTWDELANLYDKVNTGRPARTLRMDTVFAWAERQPNKFRVAADGSLYLRKAAVK
jgi:hypothetical protein